jgi:hypothetical protein
MLDIVKVAYKGKACFTLNNEMVSSLSDNLPVVTNLFSYTILSMHGKRGCGCFCSYSGWSHVWSMSAAMVTSS